MEKKSNEISGKTVVVATVIAAIILAAKIGGAAETAKTESAVKVNVNTATGYELTFLPGIGVSKARAIVDFRAKFPFKTVSDLTKVKGIGDKIAAKLAPFVVFSGLTTATAKIKTSK